jgi:hypothetical protein
LAGNLSVNRAVCAEVIDFITLIPWASKCIQRKVLVLQVSGTSLLRKKEAGDSTAGLSAMQTNIQITTSTLPYMNLINIPQTWKTAW